MHETGVVLVVDDEASIRELLRRSLASAGYQVREASTPIEACRIFLAERIDAVVLDVRMPGFSGLEFLKWLRTEPMESTSIPVFILTGYGLTNDEQEMTRRHHAQVLAKPHGVRELLDQLRGGAQPQPTRD